MEKFGIIDTSEKYNHYPRRKMVATAGHRGER